MVLRSVAVGFRNVITYFMCVVLGDFQENKEIADGSMITQE